MAVTNLILAALAANLFQDTGSTNAAVSVKASGGTLYLVNVDNSGLAAIVYIKLYHTAAVVTVGTTAPDDVILVPASFKGVILLVPAGKAFAGGLQVATVTTGGTSGTTAPASLPTVSIAYS